MINLDKYIIDSLYAPVITLDFYSSLGNFYKVL